MRPPDVLGSRAAFPVRCISRTALSSGARSNANSRRSYSCPGYAGCAPASQSGKHDRQAAERRDEKQENRKHHEPGPQRG